MLTIIGPRPIFLLLSAILYFLVGNRLSLRVIVYVFIFIILRNNQLPSMLNWKILSLFSDQHDYIRLPPFRYQSLSSLLE